MASSHIDSNPNHDEEDMMAGRIEIRTSGEKFRFVVLNRSGEKLLQSGQFDDKPSTKQAASSLARAVSGAKIVRQSDEIAHEPFAAWVARASAVK